MDNFLDELKKYFETTSPEQIDADWKKSEEFDKIGPTMNEFIEIQNKFSQNNNENTKQINKIPKSSKN
jgi:hypothetical protein